MNRMAADGRTNQEAYDTYRISVEADLRNVRLMQHRRGRIRRISRQDLVRMVVGAWCQRYRERAVAIDRRETDPHDCGLADTEAKQILVTRHRAHNAAYGMPADLTEEEVAAAESVMTRPVSSLREILSYGPSFVSLWVDAKERGLSDAEAAERLLEWVYYRPPAWTRDDDHGYGYTFQPWIDEAVKARLRQNITWRSTGDLVIPWSQEVDGRCWEVRINDFPDEHMYSLLIDGETLGDFQDWPECWDRGQDKVEARAVTPAKPRLENA